MHGSARPSNPNREARLFAARQTAHEAMAKIDISCKAMGGYDSQSYRIKNIVDFQGRQDYLANAALICKNCNAIKINKTFRRR